MTFNCCFAFFELFVHLLKFKSRIPSILLG
nr:MAG TPA: hypothetical protein [Caudoviricetes sp.]